MILIIFAIFLAGCGDIGITQYQPNPDIFTAINTHFNYQLKRPIAVKFFAYENKDLVEKICKTKNAASCFNPFMNYIYIHKSVMHNCRFIVHELLHAALFEKDLGFSHHDPMFFEHERLICLLHRAHNEPNYKYHSQTQSF